MILEFKIGGYKVYSEEVEFSLRAEPSVEKFECNVHRDAAFGGVLKSACVYGANNSGKTCLVKAFESMIDVIENKPGKERRLNMDADVFAEDRTCTLGVSFIEDGTAYGYEFKYSANAGAGDSSGFIYECMRVLRGNGSRDDGDVLFLRDVRAGKYLFRDDEKLESAMCEVSPDSILIHSVSAEKYPAVEKYKKILTDFAAGVEIVYMDRITVERTMEILKDDESSEREIEEFVKCADLDIDGFKYYRADDGAGNDDVLLPGLKEIYAGVPDDDILRLVTYHRGVPFPSVFMDSIGTLKVMSLASYMLDALKNGKTLIVDEMDAGLHFRLTRAFALLFNDEQNDSAQLIFTTHDTALLDCDRLFRKDQIWFVDKDEQRGYLYTIADVDEGGRNDEDASERYKYGEFGAIPSPRFDSVLNDMGKKHE